MSDRLELMNENLMKMIDYQYKKKKDSKMEIIIDELTKVDVFDKNLN